MKTTTIPIEGMVCGACVASVKKHIEALEGVKEVSVSLKNKDAQVIYNPKMIASEKIMETINGLGYQAKKPKEDIE